MHRAMTGLRPFLFPLVDALVPQQDQVWQKTQGRGCDLKKYPDSFFDSTFLKKGILERGEAENNSLKALIANL